MHVAIVSPRFPPVSEGGGEQGAKLLATHLLDEPRINDVTVFAFDCQGSDEEGRVTIRRLGKVSPFITEYQNLKVWWELRGKLSEFDVVHAYNMELHPVVGKICSQKNIPSVATLNSYHFFRKSVTNTTSEGLERLYEIVGYPTTGRILRAYMKRIDVFVAISRTVKDLYRSNGFDDVRIKQVPLMIDPGFDVTNESNNNSNDTFDLIYVGRIEKIKGVKHLLRAVSDLAPRYHLKIVGKGGQESNLRTLTRRLGIENRVEFAGWVSYDRLGEMYAAADLFVHPGIWPEPFGRTVLEAMQAGLPVVCTDIGGPSEIVYDDDFLCAPGDKVALAETIEYVANLRKKVGERNRDYVERTYAPSAVVSEIVDIYEGLIDDI